LTTFRRRGRINRSRISSRRLGSNEGQWAEALGDDLDYEVEELLPEKPRLRSKGIYLLPNAFTTANLFCGFFSSFEPLYDHGYNRYHNNSYNYQFKVF